MADEHLIDNEALSRSLRRLRQETDESELRTALQQVITGTRQLFSATGAGLMLIDDTSMLRFVAATDETGRLLEVRQEEIGRGPCVDALTFDQVTHVTDLADDDRWPELVRDLSEAGVRALLGVPVHAEGIPVGALNVYRDHPAKWSDSEISALEAYSTLIESLLRSAFMAHERGEVVEQLQHALDSRVTIERAVGVLMGRHGVDAVAAFNILRHSARSSGRKVADVAAELLARIPGNPE
jgi:GAF domain-containing protein